jgi:simple sugar transport system permease protein
VLFFLLACDVLILYRPRLRLWARKPAPLSAKEEPAT